METTQERLAYVHEKFLQIADETAERLHRGIERRDSMVRVVDAGKIPNCHRSGWIKNSAKHLLAELMKDAQSFNECFEDDYVSVYDLLDVLETMKSTITQ